MKLQCLFVMDSVDLVQAEMMIEEVFGTDIAIDNEGPNSPKEIVDWLEQHLSNERPNRRASTVLKKLAHAHQRPELVEGLDGRWRREQIAAIIRELFRSQNVPPTSHDDC